MPIGKCGGCGGSMNHKEDGCIPTGRAIKEILELEAEIKRIKEALEKIANLKKGDLDTELNSTELLFHVSEMAEQALKSNRAKGLAEAELAGNAYTQGMVEAAEAKSIELERLRDTLNDIAGWGCNDCGDREKKALAANVGKK